MGGPGGAETRPPPWGEGLRPSVSGRPSPTWAALSFWGWGRGEGGSQGLASGKPIQDSKSAGVGHPAQLSCPVQPEFMASNKASVRQRPSPHSALVPFHCSPPRLRPSLAPHSRGQAPSRVLQPGWWLPPGPQGPQRCGGLGPSLLTGSCRHCGKGRRQILGQSSVLRNWSPRGTPTPTYGGLPGSLAKSTLAFTP